MLERDREESGENRRMPCGIMETIFSLFPERKTPEYARFWPNSGVG
jgi:hypothetical protein